MQRRCQACEPGQLRQGHQGWGLVGAIILDDADALEACEGEEPQAWQLLQLAQLLCKGKTAGIKVLCLPYLVLQFQEKYSW